MKRLQPRHYALFLSLTVATACAGANSSSLAPSEDHEPQATVAPRNPLAALEVAPEAIQGPFASFDEFCKADAEDDFFDQANCEVQMIDSGGELGSKYIVTTTSPNYAYRFHVGFVTTKGVFVTHALSFSFNGDYYVYESHINVDSESEPGKTIISATQYRGPTTATPEERTSTMTHVCTMGETAVECAFQPLDFTGSSFMEDANIIADNLCGCASSETCLRQVEKQGAPLEQLYLDVEPTDELEQQFGEIADRIATCNPWIRFTDAEEDTGDAVASAE